MSTFADRSGSGFEPNQVNIDNELNIDNIEIKDDDAFILNIFHGKEFITKSEALFLINNLSGAMLIHEHRK